MPPGHAKRLWGIPIFRVSFASTTRPQAPKGQHSASHEEPADDVLHSAPYELQGVVFTEDKLIGEGQEAELCVRLFDGIGGSGDLE
jgi:hypothetical protein